MQGKTIKKSTIAVLLMGLFSQTAFAAEPVPDAGAVKRDNVPAPLPMPKPDATLPSADETIVVSDDKTPIAVENIVISGNTQFSNEVLSELVKEYASGEQTLGTLQKATARITEHYRKAGYFIARAYLPKQTIENGIVKIEVLEGKLGELKVENTSRLNGAKANAMLARIKAGEPLQKKSVDRALLLLSDLPSVGGVDSRVEAGANTGETNLIVGLKEAALLNGRLEADNFGSLYSGRYRIGGNVDVSSPFGFGERISARLMVSDEDLIFGRLGAQVPIGSDGLTLSGGYGRTQYSLGDKFDPLDARGNSDSFDASLRYPFIRSQNLNVYGSVGAEYRKLQDEIRSTNTKIDKNAKVGNIGVSANWRDSLGGGGANQAGLSFFQGDLDIETASAAAIDALGAKTEGSYSKWNWNLSRQQAITQKFSASLHARGQLTSDNLDSAEKFVLGGPNGVRAYPAGEGAGDIGWLASAELRYAFMPQVAASVFYDVGGIEVNADKFLTTDNTRDIAGYGLGLSGQYNAFDWRAVAAWRTTGDAVSEDDKTPRFWFQAGYRF